MRPRLLVSLVSAAAVTGAVAALPASAAAAPAAGTRAAAAEATAARPAASPVAGLDTARQSEPVTVTGAQIPAWSGPAATGVAAPYPSGVTSTYSAGGVGGDGIRSAHNGTMVVPPQSAWTGVNPDQVAAYSWTASGWKEVPVQIDQRFPNFLANGHSSFSVYSGTDEELTYAWAPDTHDTGEEAWKKAFGQCSARYATSNAEVTAAEAAGVVSAERSDSGDTGAFGGYGAAMQDPVPTFDNDDELTVMSRDAGAQAPSGVAAPPGAQNGQALQIVDPLDPTSVRYVYLYVTPHGSTFNASNGYVQMTRYANANEYIDRYSFGADDPNKLGTSNTGYGPNLTGSVCRTAPDNSAKLTTPDGTARASTDRNPRDGMTVTTPTYKLTAPGRWIVKGLQVTAPNTTGQYGPNIIARWKGRAFQQTPDSTVSLVGFEDEQVNWEMNAGELGWRAGPVRAMREIWGADSGTNVTKTEFYYRDADVFNYHVRVHPIPSDGLYTDWDYRPGVATTYYNTKTPGGVAVDGQPDGSVGEIDTLPVSGTNVYINTCDPTTTLCSAVENPEEVAGKGFGLVYDFELTGATAAAGNAAVLPYYRDDACFDDGTGDAPAPRANPGEATTDAHTQALYLAYWQKYYDDHAAELPDGTTRPAAFADLKCQPTLATGGDPTKPKDGTTPPWQIMPFQGAIAEHGIHFLVTQDSDNTASPKNTDEVDGQQWRFEVPMASPTNVTIPYGLNVTAKLVGLATPFSSTLAAGTPLPEVGAPVLLAVVALLGGGAVLLRRRRRLA